jgi:hypothetical protein
MNLILGKDPGNGAAAVMLYTKMYAQYRLPNPQTFHTTDHLIRKTSIFHPTVVDHGK